MSDRASRVSICGRSSIALAGAPISLGSPYGAPTSDEVQSVCRARRGAMGREQAVCQSGPPPTDPSTMTREPPAQPGATRRQGRCGSVTENAWRRGRHRIPPYATPRQRDALRRMMGEGAGSWSRCAAQMVWIRWRSGRGASRQRTCAHLGTTVPCGMPERVDMSGWPVSSSRR